MILTPVEMLERLGDEGEGANPVLLDSLIKGALAYVETQTRRSFRPPAVVEEIIYGRGLPNLDLSEPPITSIDYEGIRVLEAAYPGADPVEIEEGAEGGFNVRVSGHEGWLVRLGPAGRWADGREYTVRYTRGYLPGAYPADIVDLVAGLVSLRVSLAGMEAVRSESIGGYSYTRFGEGDLDAIPGALDTIDGWRRKFVGWGLSRRRL
jgi:hypothetical protein